MVTNAAGTCLSTLFDRYRDRVYWFARRLVDASTAEDVTQEVFVRLLRMADLEHREIQPSYLIKIAANIIRRDKGRRVRHERADRQIALTRPSQCAPTDETEVPHLEHLPQAQQDAVRLIVCEGLSYDDAARCLRTAVSTLNNWKFRGLRSLRDELDDEVRGLAG